MTVHYHYGAFPPANIEWDRLLPLVGPAHAAVARYEGVLHGIPNADVLLSPLTTQEAVLSSKIEGTQATLGEVLEYEATADSASDNKYMDVQEVLRYRRALISAEKRLQDLPLSQRLVRETHQVLMDGVRGENQMPGHYRQVPNWIGPPGSGMESAKVVPPDASKIPDLMSVWEKYIHSEIKDKLVDLGLIHAEFESIHPFLDGNGRVGRLLVPLFLFSKGFLSSPSFYISAFLESHRDQYYEKLLSVSRDGDWTGWCEFFLNTVISQAEDNARKAKKILKLYGERKRWIMEKTRSQYAVRALDWFFNRPIFRTSDFVQTSDIPRPTANRIVAIAKEGGLLRELRPGRGRRAAVLAFPELLNIAEGEAVF